MQLSLFPFNGPEVDIPAPPGLLGTINLLSYSLNGRVIYAQRMLSPRQPPGGILKIEFNPPHASTVRGSADAAFARVHCLSESASSGLLTVSGNPWSQHRIFEIDPNAGAKTEMPVNSPSTCGGPAGLLTPDGKRVLRERGKGLVVMSLNDGKERTVKGAKSDAECEWSPNGQQLACVSNDEIGLVNVDADVQSYSIVTKLGGAGDSAVAWSPDSRFLLIRKSELSCLTSLYGESLEAIEVATGRRIPVKSSHCKMTSGLFGWMECSILDPASKN
ncbi:MAG: hypothetical protein WA324_00630 [Bryobacteraceae bacterium]